MNYKWIFILMMLCAVLIGVEYFVIGYADAADNESYIIVYTENESVVHYPPAYLNDTRIVQGQCVEIGGVYDVSGVIGWTTNINYNAFSYYSRYEDAYEPALDNATPPYVYKVPIGRNAYFKFYVDPKVFKDRIGYWYQYTNSYERAANKRAFYVSDKCIEEINVTPVATENKTSMLNPRVIEPRHVGDILLSNDDALTLDVSGEYKMWVFGKIETKSVLAKNITTNGEGSLIFDNKISKYLNEGEYDLVLESKGVDKRYDVEYQKYDRGVTDKDLLIPTLRAIPVEDITGLQPVHIKKSLLTLLSKTDDNVTTRKIIVQQPYIDIDGYQEKFLNGKPVLEVTGYTNKIPSTPITLYIDRENTTGKSIKYPAMTVTVEKGDIGDYRTFHAFLPLYYEELPMGFHDVTAVLPSGVSAHVGFYIGAEPAPHHTEKPLFKFVDGNPFIPIPTPIVIEKEVIKEVTKEVVVEKIIKEPVDYDTLAKNQLGKLLPILAMVVIVGTPLLYICIVAIRVYAERRTKKKLEELK